MIEEKFAAGRTDRSAGSTAVVGIDLDLLEKPTDPTGISVLVVWPGNTPQETCIRLSLIGGHA